MKILDLFSGIGGFSIAGEWAGFKPVQFVENDKFCQKVLRRHWPNVPIHDDIKTFSYKEKEPIMILTGGFPCQPFSIAGKRKGKEDDRYLWPEMLRVIQETKPYWVIVENVTGILSISYNEIISSLRKSSYSTQSFIIPASGCFAPHKRERLFIVANNYRKRRKCRISYSKDRYNKNHLNWHIQKIYEEWQKFIPITWPTSQSENWIEFNTRIVRNDDGISNRMDKNRIKAIGNSVVPQAVYPIMKLIYEIEHNNQ